MKTFMITLICFLSFVSFFLFYNTSKRAILVDHYKIESWTQYHPRKAKKIGGLLAIIVGFLCIFEFGWSSFFSYLIIIMTVGSLIVIITPFRRINYQWIATTFVIFLLIETFCS